MSSAVRARAEPTKEIIQLIKEVIPRIEKSTIFALFGTNLA
jgi:hypothetical protein